MPQTAFSKLETMTTDVLQIYTFGTGTGTWTPQGADCLFPVNTTGSLREWHLETARKAAKLTTAEDRKDDDDTLSVASHNTRLSDRASITTQSSRASISTQSSRASRSSIQAVYTPKPTFKPAPKPAYTRVPAKRQTRPFIPTQVSTSLSAPLLTNAILRNDHITAQLLLCSEPQLATAMTMVKSSENTPAMPQTIAFIAVSTLWQSMRANQTDTTILELIFKYGANLDDIQPSGDSLINATVRSGDANLVRIVYTTALQYAQVKKRVCEAFDTVDANGNLAIHIAVTFPIRSNLIDTVCPLPTLISMPNAERKTPLHIAVESGHACVVNWLVDNRGVSANVDIHGNNVIDAAIALFVPGEMSERYFAYERNLVACLRGMYSYLNVLASLPTKYAKHDKLCVQLRRTVLNAARVLGAYGRIVDWNDVVKYLSICGPTYLATAGRHAIFGAKSTDQSDTIVVMLQQLFDLD